MAYDRIQPFTVDRTELMLARFMAMVASALDKKQHAPSEYMLTTERPRDDAQTLEQKFRFFYGRHQSTKRQP